MEQDKEITKVIFRKFYGKRGNSVIAIFPELKGCKPRQCICYERVGQHGECEVNYLIDITEPAKPEECSGLLEELQSMGYNLKVYKCYTYAIAQNRWKD